MNNRNDYNGEHEFDKDKAEITDSEPDQDIDGDSTLSTMIINFMVIGKITIRMI